MSTTIDNKVVEMRFDNRNFESNVKTTMSTLDKLKSALKLDGVAKSFDGITSASKKVDMRGIQNGVEQARLSFSALDVVAVTALSNITNSAINAGKKIVSALTIEPVTSGFHEYETQMGAIQTILSNTQKEGTNVQQVNAALDELNEYADKTIYNFTEMTKNIGTFTAAGVKLDTSVNAIKGIANLAAASGSSSQQASTAMYQLSQALAAGKVQLMDWNSVVNAGMGGQMFQDALIRTSELLGTGAKQAIETSGSFRESLTKTGWLTTEVLTQTLDQFATAADTQEEYNAAVQKFVSQGYTEEQARQIADMAKNAGDAATKVKKFTQMWDVLKETAQSGWATTWRLIFGDFEQAKSLFTPLTNFFSGIIQGISNARNALLESALGKSFSGLSKTITGVLEPIKEVTDGVSSAVETITDLGGIVDDVILGKFGNGEDRFNALTKASLNYYEVQNKVNEKLGNSYRYTQEQIDAQNKVLGIQSKAVSSAEQGAEATTKLTDAQKTQLKELSKLSDAQMRSKGYTDEQIAAFRELGDMAKKLGMPIDEFIDRLDELDGRMILLESFGNIIESISNIAKAVGGAFREVFKPITSDQLFNAIAGFHRLTEAFLMSKENADKLRRTFKGLFGVVKIFTSLIGGGFGLAFKVLVNILEKFDLNLLDVTATIGDVAWAVADFITLGETFEETFDRIGFVIEKVGGHIKNFAGYIASMFTGLKPDAALQSMAFKLGRIGNLPGIKQIVESFAWMYDKIAGYAESFAGLDFATGIKKVLNDVVNAFKNFMTFMKSLTWNDVINALTNFGDKVRENFTKLKEKFEEIGPDLIEGLQNGLKEGIDTIIEKMKEIGEKIIEAIKAVLGIHSPSTVMFEIGQNVVQGLINGIKSLIGGVAEIFRGLGDAITEAIGPIDWGAVSVAIFGAGMFVTLYKFTDALQGFAIAAKQATGPLDGVKNFFNELTNGVKMITGKMAGKNTLLNVATGVKTFAEAIAILATAVGALSLLDKGSLWNSVGVIAALALIMGAFTVALDKFATTGTPIETAKISGIILSLGAAFVMLGVAAKIMGDVDETAFENGKRVLIAFGACITAIMVVSGLVGNKWVASDLDKTAMFIAKIGTCFLLLGVAAKLLGTIDDGAYENAKRMISGFGVIVGLLIGSTYYAGPNIDKASKFITKIGAAFLLLSATAKILGGMESSEMSAAERMIGVFTLVVGGLVAVTGLFGNKIDKASNFIIQVSGAFALLAIAAKLMGGMEPGEMIKAGAALVALSVIVGLLVAISNLAPSGTIAKVSATLISMSLAIGILAGISVLLSFVKTENLVKGITAVTVLGILMSMMTMATRGASDIKGTMMGVAVAIGVMATAIAALSFVEPGKLAASTGAISVVMAMLALVVSQAGKANGAMKELIAISAAISVVGVILYALSGLNPESVLSSAGALSTVLLSISAALVVLDNIGHISAGALGATAILTLIVAALGGVMGLLEQFDMAPSIDTATALSTMLISMSSVMVILSSIGAAAALAVPAAIELAKVLGILALVVAAAGAIKQIPGVDWLVSEGGEFLQKIGESIGKFVGGFVGGALDGLTDNLVAVADNLSNFITHLTPFLEGVKMIDPSMKTGIDSLVGMIMSLTGSSFITGVAELLGISTDFGALGDKLVPFGEAMQRYSVAIQGIDSGAIQASAAAGQALSDLANSLPKEGGLSQAIFGTNEDLGIFGSQLAAFGNCLMAYSSSVTGLSIEPIQQSVSAATALNELAKQLGSEGGVIAFFTGGQKGLDDFGSELKKFGTGLKDYSDSLSEVNFAVISTATGKAKQLAEFAKTLLEADFSGVLKFNNIANVGVALKNYYDKISGIELGKINTSINVMTMIVNSINNMGDINIANIVKFQTAIAMLGTTDLNSVVSAFESAGSRAFAAGLNFVKMLANGFLSGTGSVQRAAAQVLAIVLKSIQSASELFSSAGTELAEGVASGISDGKTSVDSAVISLVDGAANSLKSYRDSFKSAGSYVASGFAAGIRSGITAAAKAAARMASAALSAAKKNLDINSPSKVFRKIGYSVPEGFAQGIDRFSRLAENSAVSMADNAVKSTSEVLSGLGKTLNLDADMDLNPVITPVLDLDNIKNGSSAIDDMLSKTAPIGVLRNVNTINRQMNRNLQNGANDEVVGAIDKLRKSMGDIGGNSYNINGITYDDGSAVSEAVQGLIRAIRIEGRV